MSTRLTVNAVVNHPVLTYRNSNFFALMCASLDLNLWVSLYTNATSRVTDKVTEMPLEHHPVPTPGT